MKKFFILLFAIFAFTFVSCSDDPASNTDPSANHPRVFHDGRYNFTVSTGTNRYTTDGKYIYDKDDYYVSRYLVDECDNMKKQLGSGSMVSSFYEIIN